MLDSGIFRADKPETPEKMEILVAKIGKKLAKMAQKAIIFQNMKNDRP